MVSIQAISAVSFSGKKGPAYQITTSDKRALSSGNQGQIAHAVSRMIEGNLIASTSTQQHVEQATKLAPTLVNAIMQNLQKRQPQPATT